MSFELIIYQQTWYFSTVDLSLSSDIWFDYVINILEHCVFVRPMISVSNKVIWIRSRSLGKGSVCQPFVYHLEWQDVTWHSNSSQHGECFFISCSVNTDFRASSRGHRVTAWGYILYGSLVKINYHFVWNFIFRHQLTDFSSKREFHLWYQTLRHSELSCSDSTLSKLHSFEQWTSPGLSNNVPMLIVGVLDLDDTLCDSHCRMPCYSRAVIP